MAGAPGRARSRPSPRHWNPCPMPVPTPASENTLRAIGYMLATVMLFGCLDATAKYLATVPRYPVPQVLWMRFLAQVLLVLAFAPTLGAPSRTSLLWPNRPLAQVTRSVLMLLTTYFNFEALRHLRLDQTATISFLTPLVVAVLAGPLLGEWIGWRRLVAVLVGFCGVLVAVRPGFAAVPPEVVYSFLSMAAYALFMLLTRWLAAHDPPTRTLFWSMAAGLSLGAPFAFAEWQSPRTLLDLALMLSMGLTGGLAHFFLILAHRHAPASTVAPFIYLQLVSMVLFGWLVFNDVPDMLSLVGAGIVIGSGIYLWDRERRLAALRATDRRSAEMPS